MIVHSTYCHYIISDKLICGRRICRTILGWGQAPGGLGLIWWMQTRSPSSTCRRAMAHIAAMAQIFSPSLSIQTAHDCGPTVRCPYKWASISQMAVVPKHVQGHSRGILTAIGPSLKLAKGPVALCHESKRGPLTRAGAGPHYPIPNIAKSTAAAPLARLLLPSLRRSDVVICRPPVPSHNSFSRSGVMGYGLWELLHIKALPDPAPTYACK
jgi:hypothetical protein